MKVRFLTLFRHAKSSWDKPELSDVDRPLAARGLRDAPLVAKRNKRIIHQVEHFYCSTAQRARQTLDEILFVADMESPEVSWHDSLYTFDASQVLAFCKKLPEHIYSVGLIGHNPGFTQIVNQLTCDNLENLPTASIARIRIKTNSWQELDASDARLVYYTCPKNYR